MPRDFEMYLWDLHQAGMDILESTHDKTLEDYLSDRNLRRAVERNLEIVGKALVQVRHHHPYEAGKISDATRIIAFRKRLAPAYSSVVDDVVWFIIQDDLPLLIAEVTVLLDEWHQG